MWLKFSLATFLKGVAFQEILGNLWAELTSTAKKGVREGANYPWHQSPRDIITPNASRSGGLLK